MSRIGEMLMKYGIITEEQLDEALRMQQKSDKRLGELLIDLGYLNSDDLHWMLSEQADLPFVEIHPEMLEASLIMRFPKELLYDHTILPLHESETRVYVVVGDPTDTPALQQIEQAASKTVAASVAAPEKIKRLLDNFFAESADKMQMVTCVRMTANHAEIEFIEAGKKRKRKCSSAEIEIRIGRDKGEPKDE
jgi:type IV pilus assembly protein PilB